MPQIIVTGPQRSGTTIASRILADDLGMECVDELYFQPGKQYSNHVIQSPNALDGFIFIHHIYPDATFVFIDRPKSDIIASMRRIRWCYNDVQDWDQFVSDWIDQKHLLWKQLQEYLPLQTQQIPYQSLSGHRLFVQRQHRTDFTSKQWKPGEPIGPRYWSNNTYSLQELSRERYRRSTQE